ncbi:unnamed protein product [Rhodiola kirilowii]
MDKIVRRASHAGSWYSDNPQKLSKELEGWLTTSGLPKSPEVRGVIAPHAGYSYSGRAAAYAFGNIDPSNIYSVKIVPILVGALSAEKEAFYGRLLAKYANDPKNFFSVSSDFCHWGSRFNYTHYDKKHGAIYKSIEALDRMGMDIIETGDPDSFKKYLKEFDNTICGRHPISVFLHMLKNCSADIKINFLRYEQSSQCKSTRDSSVSYASAAAKIAGKA